MRKAKRYAARRKQCTGCDQLRYTIRARRQYTAYPNEADNIVTVCYPCYCLIQAYWTERWDDYYTDLRSGLSTPFERPYLGE